MAETGARPKVPRLQRRLLSIIGALTTPLLPDDYLELINPLWSTRELRGRIESIDEETPDAATVADQARLRWEGHEPGQYLRVGLDIKGRRHWRAYSLTSDPERPDGCISITVKNVDEGTVSPYLVRRGAARQHRLASAASRATSCSPTTCPTSCCSSAPAAGSRRS